MNFLIVFTSCNSKDSNKALIESLENELSIEFPEISQNINVRARSWGISGNHEEITFSSDSNALSYDSLQKQIFFTSEIFYKKKGIDTLIIFAPKSSYKDEYLQVIGKVKLVIKPLTNNDDIVEYNKRYVQLGLKKVSIYD